MVFPPGLRCQRRLYYRICTNNTESEPISDRLTYTRHWNHLSRILRDFNMRYSQVSILPPQVSKTGRVLFAKAAATSNATRLGGALYSPGELLDTDNDVTIGCVLRAQSGSGVWDIFGVTFATPSDGTPKRRPSSSHVPSKSPLSQGDDREICVLPPDLTVHKANKSLHSSSYEQRGLGIVQSLPFKLDTKVNGTKTCAPWCRVLFDKTVLPAAEPPVDLNGYITTTTNEPQVGTELIILGQSATNQHARCLVLESTAWMRSPGFTDFFPCRRLQLLPKHCKSIHTRSTPCRVFF